MAMGSHCLGASTSPLASCSLAMPSAHGLMPTANGLLMPSEESLTPSHSSQSLNFFWDSAALYGEALGSLHDELFSYGYGGNGR